MKINKNIPVHEYEINGEIVELVLDMRAKDLEVKYAFKVQPNDDDYVMKIVILFAAMYNSACIRNNDSENMIDVTDLMESDIDIDLITKIVQDVKNASYAMEYKRGDPNDLYADEVADNEKNLDEGVS